MSTKSRLFFLLALAVLTAAAISYNSFMGSAVRERRELYIGADTGYGGLLEKLQPLAHSMAFDRYAKYIGLPDSFKPGHYVIEPGMGVIRIARMLKYGYQTPVNITFNNIRTLPELAGRLAAQLQVDSLTLSSLLLSDSVASWYGFDRANFIGMFIPDTYQFYWTTSPSALLDRMRKEYDRFWNDSRLAKLQTTGLSREQVATMASIIDEETARSDEMASIAGVYMNRIRRGMPLQADPTVKFALGEPAMKRILRKYLEIDSPYNTYKYAGLPPGPIRMPSIRAIGSVLDYRRHDYLYFCARADFSGYHAFARTLEEHNRNARAYTRALDEAGIR